MYACLVNVFWNYCPHAKRTRGKHSKPHIHALYGEHEIVVGIDGEILEGGFLNKQLKLLLAWMAIHEDELTANWELLRRGDGYFKIDPLR